MSSTESDEGNLSDDLVGVDQYEAASRPKMDFLPWHRARKQFVREEQWCVQIAKLIDDTHSATFKREELTYCGLPGSDLIDLRCIHDSICAPRSMAFRFLGFNSAAAPRSQEEIELNISNDEVKKLPFVEPASEVVPDDFRAVGNKDSIAYGKVELHGPFDIVNLDLCDSFAADEIGLFNDNYYDAIAQLLAVQARQKTPWLLLLTTRVGSAHVHPETLKKFQKRYTANLISCESFKKESQTLFNIGDDQALVDAIETATGLHSVFITAICKWLIALALGHDSTIELKSALGYRVEKSAEATDLVSLALRFTPHAIPAQDSLGLAQVAQELPDECSQAVKAIRRVAKLCDVDGLLAKDTAIRDAMISNMSTLLKAARYDISTFPAWEASQT